MGIIGFGRLGKILAEYALAFRMSVLAYDPHISPNKSPHHVMQVSLKKLLKKAIYLPLEQLRELDDVSFYDHEVLGYEVIDSIKGSIGKVINVIDIASNPLMQTEINGKEVLLPIFDGLVKKVDRKKMTLYIEAPEGLIDLYL
jgi:ribosomal 30S subunit maturation factor RimM